MRLKICAVGRLRAGPERDLITDWSDRCNRTGRALGLGPLEIVEVDDRKGGGPASEGEQLLRHIPKGAKSVALDERGRVLTSPDLAKQLAHWRDDGVPETAFLIGGADGLAASVRKDADLVLSFGAMVWPHMLARAMLTEQLYRATTILAGSPYHRE